MRKEKDEVIRCGYKVGGGAKRDQAFEKHADGGMHGIEVGDRKLETYTREFNKGGKAKTECHEGRVKRDVGGVLNTNNNMQNNNPQNKQIPIPNPVSGNPGPVNINYGLKKGGKANVKKSVKQRPAPKEVKAPRLSAALIDSISIMPTKRTGNTKKEEPVLEKAMGGAAKIRQGVFGLKGNPVIKR